MVDCSSLENCRTFTGSESSNLSPSAIKIIMSNTHRGKIPQKYFWRDNTECYITAHGSGNTKRRTCSCCGFLTYKWDNSGGAWACYDGCYNTTGRDWRTVDGKPKF